MSKKLVEKEYIDDTMRQSYFERETIATTEIGNMVAIPHGAKGEVYENKVAIGILKRTYFLGSRKSKIGYNACFR